MKSYRDKYYYLLKEYHKMHELLSGLTMGLQEKLDKMDLDDIKKNSLLGPIYNTADRIIVIDEAVSNLNSVRSTMSPDNISVFDET